MKNHINIVIRIELNPVSLEGFMAEPEWEEERVDGCHEMAN